MNDCPNAEIRDQLPDLLHDRLDVSMRAAVMAHVDECVDCRSELELLRGVHGMLTAQTPRVDINYVVNALPKRAPQALRVVPRRRAWADWRIAAAVTVLAIGSGSFAVLRQSGTTSSVTAPPDPRHAYPSSAASREPRESNAGRLDERNRDALDRYGRSRCGQRGRLRDVAGRREVGR